VCTNPWESSGNLDDPMTTEKFDDIGTPRKTGGVEDGRLMSSSATAKYLDISPRKLFNLSGEGEDQIPFYRVGAVKRYRKPEIDAWLEKQRVGATLNRAIG